MAMQPEEPTTTSHIRLVAQIDSMSESIGDARALRTRIRNLVRVLMPPEASVPGPDISEKAVEPPKDAYSILQAAESDLRNIITDCNTLLDLL